jgi:hypothetical protein
LHGLPEITTDLFFAFQGFVEFLNDLLQLIGISRPECGVAQLSPISVFACGHSAPPLNVWLLQEYCGSPDVRQSFSAETEELLDLFGLTVMLLRPTGRRGQSPPA